MANLPSPSFTPPKGVWEVAHRLREPAYRQALGRWLCSGSTAPIEPPQFKPPDGPVQALWECLRSKYYRRAYLYWLRHGPNEERDAAAFARQWTAAKDNGGDITYVEKGYNDQRKHRQMSLANLKLDTQSFFSMIGLLVATAAVIVAVAAPARVRALLDSSERYLLLLIPIACVLAMLASTHRFFYSLFTHYHGAAEYGEKITGDQSYVNELRKEVNRLSRTDQRNRRRSGLAKSCLIVGVLFFGYVMLRR